MLQGPIMQESSCERLLFHWWKSSHTFGDVICRLVDGDASSPLRGPPRCALLALPVRRGLVPPRLGVFSDVAFLLGVPCGARVKGLCSRHAEEGVRLAALHDHRGCVVSCLWRLDRVAIHARTHARTSVPASARTGVLLLLRVNGDANRACGVNESTLCHRVEVRREVHALNTRLNW